MLKERDLLLYQRSGGDHGPSRKRLFLSGRSFTSHLRGRHPFGSLKKLKGFAFLKKGKIGFSSREGQHPCRSEKVRAFTFSFSKDRKGMYWHRKRRRRSSSRKTFIFLTNSLLLFKGGTRTDGKKGKKRILRQEISQAPSPCRKENDDVQAPVQP